MTDKQYIRMMESTILRRAVGKDAKWYAAYMAFKEALEEAVDRVLEEAQVHSK